MPEYRAIYSYIALQHKASLAHSALPLASPFLMRARTPYDRHLPQRFAQRYRAHPSNSWQKKLPASACKNTSPSVRARLRRRSTKKRSLLRDTMRSYARYGLLDALLSRKCGAHGAACDLIAKADRLVWSRPQPYLRNSSRAICARCTSSGPSARRKVRLWAYMAATGKS